ncbi:hypothetical protein F5X99DRAFT_428799 [Biscogniauxia marginata]|nr:hypothetical protein F5X99DRAFT_428799 [Biscogniauxia marginata]
MAVFDFNPVLALISQNQDNTTALKTIFAPRWVDDTGFRGTSGLVVSCVGTLLACVYTALHLNMLKNSGLWAIFRAKAKWVAIALMAPELVLYMAAQQFIEARALLTELNKLKDEQSASGEYPEFALEYAFFVVMGGLQIDVSEFLSENCRQYQPYHHQAFPGDSVPKRLAITPRGLIQLAKHGHFLRVSLATIEDKSKSDKVQKFLVVGQLCWMITQCITRLVFGLPLCLLEVHTVVHAKPLDINDPEVIHPEALNHIIAFMVQEQYYEFQSTQLMVYQPWTSENASRYPKVLSSKINDPGEFTYEMTDTGQYAAVDWIDGAWGEINLRPGQALKCGIGFVKRDMDIGTEKTSERADDATTGADDDAQGDPDPDILKVDFIDQERWKSMIDFLELRYGRCPHPYLFHPHHGPRHPDGHYHDAFTADPGNMPYAESGVDMWDLISHVQQHPLLLLLLLVLPAAYGGIHLAGWNFEFPSRAERVCWRASCLLIVAAFPALFGLAHACSAAEQWAVRRQLWGVIGPDFFSRSRNAMWYGTLFLYALARLFIVAEAFASLRRVPIGVFWMPPWLEMVPHL